MTRLLGLLLLCAGLASAQFNVSSQVIRFTDGTNIFTAGDNANNALRVNVVAGGGAGGTSSSYAAAFPATGTAAGFSDGTNMQGARVFDVDSGGGTQYVLGVNLRLTGSGGSTEALGQQTMANSIPVAIASNQGNLNVVVASALPAGTNAIGKVYDQTPCGTTVVSAALQVLPNAATAPSGFTSTTCVMKLVLANYDSVDRTVTLTDGQGTPVTFLNAFNLPAKATLEYDFGGVAFTTGIKWNASNATGVAGAVWGYQ
jgi:hypothetical protein